MSDEIHDLIENCKADGIDPWDNEHSSFQSVKVSSIKANQVALSRINMVMIMNEGKIDTGFDEEICVVKHKNQYILQDGNHRTALAKLSGRTSITARVFDADKQLVKKADEEIEKFNPYHDERGRFTTADSATLFTIRTKDPDKQYLANEGIRREQARDAAERQENGPQMKTIHDIEDKIRDQDAESAALVDKDGNVLFYKDGDVSSVGFTKEECLMMKDNVLTHNHPGSSMFSSEDVDLWAYWGLQGIRATTREGVTYSLERGDGYTKDKGDDFSLNFRFDYIKAKHSAQKIMADKGIPWKLQKGEMTDEQASAEYRKIIASEFSKLCTEAAPKFGIKFSVETRAVGKSAGNTVYKATADDDGEIVAVLDKDTEADITVSFNAWLRKVLNNPQKKGDTIDTPEVTQTTKSADNSEHENAKETNCTLVKMDDDKRLVFGWASISITTEGEQLEDLQHDLINPEDLEEAVYEYVLHFRDTGEEHRPHLRKKGKLVESCVFTVEKQRAMGLPEGILPVGWWIGFKIEDDEAWEKVKNGTYRMFSIEGKAQRVPVEKAAPTEYDCIEEVSHGNIT